MGGYANNLPSEPQEPDDSARPCKKGVTTEAQRHREVHGGFSSVEPSDSPVMHSHISLSSPKPHELLSLCVSVCELCVSVVVRKIRRRGRWLPLSPLCDEPRSGGRCVAWGVSPRKRMTKKSKSPWRGRQVLYPGHELRFQGLGSSALRQGDGTTAKTAAVRVAQLRVSELEFGTNFATVCL